MSDWSSKKPTEPGVYLWCVNKSAHELRVCEIKELEGGGDGLFIDFMLPELSQTMMCLNDVADRLWLKVEL